MKGININAKDQIKYGASPVSKKNNANGKLYGLAFSCTSNKSALSIQLKSYFKDFARSFKLKINIIRSFNTIFIVFSIYISVYIDLF